MKKRVYMMVAALTMCVASFAQTPQTQDAPAQQKQMPTVEEMARMRADRMKQQLLLSNDQYDKVYKLCLEQAEADQARMKQIKAEREAMAAKMKGLLNETQYERFEQMQQRRGMPFDKRRGDHHKDGDGRNPQRLSKGPQVPPQGGMRNNMHDDTRDRRADKAEQDK